MTTFTADADWLPYHPEPSSPRFPLPPGAVDAHCHVFGPGERFPYAPQRNYTPTDAGKDELFALRDHLGFSRNVIVQATCHGNDNAALVDALSAAGDRARGVASVGADVSTTELADLHAAGVRGVRFNFVRRLADPQPAAYYHRIVERISEFGWHVVVYFEAADLVSRWDFLTSLKITVVVDHLGRPELSESPDGSRFGQFRRLLAEHPNYWTKVTCPERLSHRGPPGYDDFVPFARTVIEEFPDRVLWGTDWPHPNMRTHMPDDGALVDVIPRIAVTAEAQQKLLVDNPNRLYWTDTSDGS